MTASTSAMADSPALPKPVMLLIALVQGLLLFLLHEALEFKFWPHGSPHWLFSFYTLVIVLPLTLMLSLEQQNWRSLVKILLPFALVAACLGFYIGTQAVPVEQVRSQALLFGFVFTLAVATFKVLMYAQQFASGEPFTYSNLYRFSWRNFLTLLLASVFMGSVWGILLLWAALFEVIEIHFFDDLFRQRWFYYPTLTLALGFGLLIFRNLSRLIDTIARIQQALMKFLLIILVLVSVLFLFALPFTGLAPLWKTGHGSTLILWLQALMLFFTNAVYQEDANARPYPPVIHRLIYCGLALLPVYSAIAFYGLSLRVEQYGWTVERCWGFLVWALLTLFSLGYLWGIIKLRDRWLERLSWVNVRMGLVLLFVLLLVNSPLLDFRKITVRDQLDRFDRGLIKPEDFSFYYFRRDLARPGYEALQKVRAAVVDTHPEIALLIDNLYSGGKPAAGSLDRELFLRSISRPVAQVLPESLVEQLYRWVQQRPWRLRNYSGLHLLAADLNGDGRDEFVLLELEQHHTAATLFTQNGDQWRELTMRGRRTHEQERQVVKDLLQKNQIEVVVPHWHQLQIGDLTLQVDAVNAAE